MWQKLHWRNRFLAVRLYDHRHSLKEGPVGKSELAQQAHEEGHMVGWDEARILEIESNSRYRKYKKLAHVTCLTNALRHLSLDSSPVWIPLINNEISML
jgi:hypothetical protein